jgi:hypothetical protein
MELSDKSIIKHSAAVQISNTINLLQRRAWNVLLANAYYDLPKQEVFEVDYEDYMQVLGIDKRRNRRYVEEYLGGLISTRIEWNVLGKVSEQDWDSEWGTTGLLASAVIKKVKGRKKILYAYSHELRQRLFNPRLYARISLSMQNKFNSKHALALYELCVDYFIARKCQGQSPFIPLADFRKVMGLEAHEYKEFKFLRQWIIKKPLSEINTKSDLLVRVEFKKEKRRIVALKFHISPQKNNPALLFEHSTAGIKNMELYQRLKDYFHLTSIQANEILATYQEEDILENLRYVEGKIREGQVRSIGAYTLKAIKENYRSQPNLFEREQREKQQAIDDALQQQRDIDRLNRQYESEREKSFQRCLKEFPSEKIAILKAEAAQEMEKRYGNNFRLLDTLSARRFKDRLLECTGFPAREEWIEGKASARLSVGECA